MTKVQIDNILVIVGQVATIVLKASSKDVPGTLDAATALAATLEFPKAVTIIGEIKTILPFFTTTLPALPKAPVSPNPAKS